MYSQQDLDAAVASGVMTAENAREFRAYVAHRRGIRVVDEEQFRLVTGFNDIFVSIALIILLFSIGWLGESMGRFAGLYMKGILSEKVQPSYIGPLAVAGASWMLALFFTARRRMALPSILLVISFILSILISLYFTPFGLIAPLASVGAAWLHWRRFYVPITIGLAAACFGGAILYMLHDWIGNDMSRLVIFLLGIINVILALWWDMSDRARLTWRSDVAFWLHLVAAPMIVHPMFTLLVPDSSHATLSQSIVVILLYLLLGIVSLAINRRALLASALAYVLMVLADLFQRFGMVELSIAFTALIIGSGLLLLSAFWHQARAMIVNGLSECVRNRLPLV